MQYRVCISTAVLCTYEVYIIFAPLCDDYNTVPSITIKPVIYLKVIFI